MKILIKYNHKLSKWIILLNKKVLFSLNLIKQNNNIYSKYIYTYFILLKILRQFGLKKAIVNLKQY